MKKVLVIAFAVIIIGYALFEGWRLLEGPQIHIESPSNGSATSSVAVSVTGVAENISFLTINDAPAYTDENGRFNELLSLPPGYTVVTVSGVDRFGRRVIEQVSIIILNYCSI